jgi:hypothetical protein
MNNKFNYWIVVALIAGVLIGWFIHQPQILNTTSSSTPKNTITTSSLDFNNNMRKLWEDHITWTRLYIISAVNGTGDKDQVLARLMQNQVEIGNAIKPYYGNDAGDKLTTLLKSHISLAGDIINAAVANDNMALQDANSKWYDNANQIADFLASANPNWKKDELRSMMKDHLDLTKQEAVDIIGKNANANISDYDKVHDEILKMADTLSNGIIKQYPNKFKL